MTGRVVHGGLLYWTRKLSRNATGPQERTVSPQPEKSGLTPCVRIALAGELLSAGLVGS